MTFKLLFSVLGICASFAVVQPKDVHDLYHFDVLIFTQQWPATVCREWKDHDKSHTCSMPRDEDTWTIHGIWPTKFGTIGPGYCNRSWHFDPEQIKPIEMQLTQLWTNIEKGTPPYEFWTHEWTKHGTCAAVLEPLNSEFKYFSKGLEWLKKYSMTDILREVGIIPSDDKLYVVGDIYKAIHSKFGVNPAIECRKEDGKSWLVEIRICFDKTLQLHNCDGIVDMERTFHVVDNKPVGILTNCGPTNDIIYPHDPVGAPPKRIYVQLYKLVSWLQWFTL